jgi:Homeodomain-like domain
MDKDRIALTVEERTGVEQLVSGGKSAARKLTPARILLLADEWPGQACSDTEIVSALGGRLRTIERVRKRWVTEGFAAARDHQPQPPRPDKLKIKGNVEQKLLELACSDPPRGRCHWTLQLLVDELVVLGLVDTVSTVTVWQAVKKMTSTRGSSKPGVSRPRRTPSTYGAWRTCFRPTCGRTIRATPLCALTKRASSGLARYGQRNRYAQASQLGATLSLSARASVTSC